MLNVLVPLEQTRAYQEIFAKGDANGEARGKADSLKHLLTRRFGELPRWAVSRLNTADIPQLDGWLEVVLDAQSLEDALGPAPKRKAAERP